VANVSTPASKRLRCCSIFAAAVFVVAVAAAPEFVECYSDVDHLFNSNKRVFL